LTIETSQGLEIETALRYNQGKLQLETDSQVPLKRKIAKHLSGYKKRKNKLKTDSKVRK
jgi:hypothetical protein